MKVKPKEVMLNLPIVLLFDQEYKVPEFAANINQLMHGKVKVKYEELGTLGEQFVGLFYLQRNDEFSQLRQEFVELIEQERIRHHEMELAAKRMADEQTQGLTVKMAESTDDSCNGFCEAEKGCPRCWDPYGGFKP
jgi:hypothetical protein